MCFSNNWCCLLFLRLFFLNCPKEPCREALIRCPQNSQEIALYWRWKIHVESFLSDHQIWLVKALLLNYEFLIQLLWFRKSTAAPNFPKLNVVLNNQPAYCNKGMSENFCSIVNIILLHYDVLHCQNSIHIYLFFSRNAFWKQLTVLPPFTFCIFLHQVYKMSASGFACLHALSLLRIQQMEPWDGGYQPSHSPLDCNSLSTMCYGP